MPAITAAEKADIVYCPVFIETGCTWRFLWRIHLVYLHCWWLFTDLVRRQWCSYLSQPVLGLLSENTSSKISIEDSYPE